MKYRQACKAVIAHCPNRWAKAYAHAGLRLDNQEAIKVQALYLLCNIQHWRGAVAKKVRATLKERANG